MTAPQNLTKLLFCCFPPPPRLPQLRFAALIQNMRHAPLSRLVRDAIWPAALEAAGYRSGSDRDAMPLRGGGPGGMEGGLHTTHPAIISNILPTYLVNLAVGRCHASVWLKGGRSCGHLGPQWVVKM